MLLLIEMKKVDFFIVGQPKSGTTALAQFLEEHPEITITIPKETGFWARDLMDESEAFHSTKNFQTVRSMEEYTNSFKHANKDQLVGDASTTYLYSKTAAKEIKKYNPKAKIIIMLRNPMDMVYSL